MTFSSGDFVDYSDQNDVFERMAAIERASFNLTGNGGPERIQGARITPSIFPLLGIDVARGRAFSDVEGQPNSNQVVILGHGLWKRRFGSDPGIIGRTVILNEQVYNVIGVLPAETQLPTFPPNFPVPSLEPELWVPMALDRNRLARTGNNLFMLGRLKHGINLKQAQASMSIIARRLEQQYPQSNAGIDVLLITLPDQAVGDMRRALLLLFAASSLVLLIACANVANLLLARSSARGAEMAVRSAMGAGRRRLLRQLLTESGLLALSGGTLGLLLAYMGIRLIIAISPASVPRVKAIGIDGWVLGFTLLLSLLTGVIFGLAPSWQTSRNNLIEQFKDGGKGVKSVSGHLRFRGLLVVSEISLALMLLIGAGLLIKSLARLTSINLGFDPANLMTFQATLPRSKYEDPDRQKAFFEESLQRIGGLPGVQSAAAINFLPLSGADAGMFITIESAPIPAPGNVPSVSFRAISSSYFRTMRIPIVNGREFTAEDVAKHRIIINDSLARRYFPDLNPIDRRIKLARPEEDGPSFPVVGVASDVKQFGLRDEERPTLYFPYLEQPSMSFVVRTAADPLNIVTAVRNAVQSVDKDQPLYNIKAMEDIVADQTAKPSFRTMILATFAAVALLLAIAGIYGVTAYSVTQRTQEIGIRMALGAHPGSITKMLIKQGMALTAVGIIIGLAMSFALTRLLRGFLYDVTATDAVTFVVSPLLLIAVALLANFLPARKAAKLNPMTALRYE
jgi:putative ABC transport system permease protein